MSDEPSKTSASPWSQTGFVLAAAFVAVLVLIGALILVTGGDGDDGDGDVGKTAPARTADPSTTQDTKTATDPDASVCGLAAGAQKLPAAPPEARWELVGTVAAPTEPTTLGPGITKGDRRLCFAHSPAGALFAAINFIAVAAKANDDEGLMQELTAEGAARDELLKEDTQSKRNPDFRLQVAGFRFPAVEANEVTVEVALAATGVDRQGYVAMTLPMRWERGDWKLVITSTEETYGAQRINGISGYVPWSGA